MQVPAIEGLVRARDALLQQVSSLRWEMAELVRHRDDLLRQLSLVGSSRAVRKIAVITDLGRYLQEVCVPDER